MAGTLVANTINTDTGIFSINNAYSGIASAWCRFNGTAGTINASFNITSLTKNGTGDYTVNLTTGVADANAAVLVQQGDTSATAGGSGIRCTYVSTITSTSARLICVSGATDFNEFSVVIFR